MPNRRGDSGFAGCDLFAEVKRWVVDNPVGRPGFTVVAIADVEKESAKTFGFVAVRNLRGDVVLNCEIANPRSRKIVHCSISRDRHAQRPPSGLGDLHSFEIVTQSVTSNADPGVVMLPPAIVLAFKFNEHARPVNLVGLRVANRNQAFSRFVLGGLQSDAKREMGAGTVFPRINWGQIDADDTARFFRDSGSTDFLMNVADEIVLLKLV